MTRVHVYDLIFGIDITAEITFTIKAGQYRIINEFGDDITPDVIFGIE